MADSGYPAYTPAVPADVVRDGDGRLTPVGAVVAFAGAAAPNASWGLCDGSLYSKVDLPALFAVIGTTYGGDGNPNFAVPDLRTRVPMGPGNGRVPGNAGGEESHQLSLLELPNLDHAHFLTSPVPGRNGGSAWSSTQTPSAGAGLALEAAIVGGAVNEVLATVVNGPNHGASGGAHNNLQPYLVLNYLIRLS